MPNWCSNTMTVTGPKEVVDLFIERAKGKPPEFKSHPMEPVDSPSEEPDEEILSFHKFVPIPQGLLERTFGNEGGPQTPIDGFVSGYDWQSERWGCKWGASDTQLQRVSDNEAIYTFETPWAPPVALMEAIAEMPEFRSLTITNEYNEPGMMFQGETIIQDGECSDSCEEMDQDDLDELYPVE